LETDAVGDAGALGVELGVADAGRIEIDAERPRAEATGRDGDAAVAGAKIDHVVLGTDFSDLQHAVDGFPRGRDKDDVETLRPDIGHRNDPHAQQECGVELPPGDGRSRAPKHPAPVFFAEFSIISFKQSPPRNRYLPSLMTDPFRIYIGWDQREP